MLGCDCPQDPRCGNWGLDKNRNYDKIVQPNQIIIVVAQIVRLIDRHKGQFGTIFASTKFGTKIATEKNLQNAIAKCKK